MIATADTDLHVTYIPCIPAVIDPSTGGQEAAVIMRLGEEVGRAGMCRRGPTPRPSLYPHDPSWPPTCSAAVIVSSSGYLPRRPGVPVDHSEGGQELVWPCAWVRTRDRTDMPLLPHASPISNPDISWSPIMLSVINFTYHVSLRTRASHTSDTPRALVDPWLDWRPGAGRLGEGVGQDRQTPLSSHASPMSNGRSGELGLPCSAVEFLPIIIMYLNAVCVHSACYRHLVG
jgi:hypothetical protein